MRVFDNGLGVVTPSSDSIVLAFTALRQSCIAL